MDLRTCQYSIKGNCAVVASVFRQRTCLDCDWLRLHVVGIHNIDFYMHQIDDKIRINVLAKRLAINKNAACRSC